MANHPSELKTLQAEMQVFGEKNADLVIERDNLKARLTALEAFVREAVKTASFNFTEAAKLLP